MRHMRQETFTMPSHRVARGGPSLYSIVPLAEGGKGKESSMLGACDKQTVSLAGTGGDGPQWASGAGGVRCGRPLTASVRLLARHSQKVFQAGARQIASVFARSWACLTDESGRARLRSPKDRRARSSTVKKAVFDRRPPSRTPQTVL